MGRKIPVIVLSRKERMLVGRRRKIIKRRKPMQCEWCHGRMFIDSFPCTHCVGGITNCCDGGPGAVYGGDAEIQEGCVAQRIEGGSDSDEPEASDSDYAI